MPDVLLQELMHIDQQLAGRLVASEEYPLNAAHQEKYILSALREEAIASSMIEGAATTRVEAKEMLLTGRKPRTKGERMVANNYEAISFIREHRNSDLTPEFLLKVQRIVTEETLQNADECGRFRTDQDNVCIVDRDGNVIHTPPAANELPHRIQMLCDFANETIIKTGFVHPVIRASIIHFQIGFDHPFCDGNGRTARAMFYWSMLKSGYWMFEYLPISRLIYSGPAKYVNAYVHCEKDEFDVTYFLVYIANLIARARKDLETYIAKKQNEINAARNVFETDYRLNHRQRELIFRLIRSPNMSVAVNDYESRHNIAYATARKDLLDLSDWDYLTKFQEGKRFIFLRGPKLEVGA